MKRLILALLALTVLPVLSAGDAVSVVITIPSMVESSRKIMEFARERDPKLADFIVSSSTLFMMSPQMAMVDPTRPIAILVPAGSEDWNRCCFLAYAKEKGLPGTLDLGKRTLYPSEEKDGRWLYAPNGSTAAAFRASALYPRKTDTEDVMLQLTFTPSSGMGKMISGHLQSAKDPRETASADMLLLEFVRKRTDRILANFEWIRLSLDLPNPEKALLSAALQPKKSTLCREFFHACPGPVPEAMPVISGADVLFRGQFPVTPVFQKEYLLFLDECAAGIQDSEVRDAVLRLKELIPHLSGTLSISSYREEGILIAAGLRKGSEKTILEKVRTLSGARDNAALFRLENRTWFTVHNGCAMICSTKLKDHSRIRLLMETAVSFKAPSPAEKGTLMDGWVVTGGVKHRTLRLWEDASGEIRIQSDFPAETLRKYMPENPKKRRH